MHHKSPTDFTVSRAQASHLNIYEVLNSMDRAECLRRVTHPTWWHIRGYSDWELFWIHRTKGSTKELLNSQPKADIPLLDNKISELNPTYISPLLWLWQPLRKDRLLSLFHHTTSVSSSSCAHKQLLSLFFCSMFQTAEHPKSLAGLSGRQLPGARDCGNKSSHLAPKYGFRRLTLASDFFKLGMVLKFIHEAS